MGSPHLKAGTTKAGLILGSLDPVDLATPSCSLQSSPGRGGGWGAAGLRLGSALYGSRVCPELK